PHSEYWRTIPFGRTTSTCAPGDQGGISPPSGLAKVMTATEPPACFSMLSTRSCNSVAAMLLLSAAPTITLIATRPTTPSAYGRLPGSLRSATVSLRTHRLFAGVACDNGSAHKIRLIKNVGTDKEPARA